MIISSFSHFLRNCHGDGGLDGGARFFFLLCVTMVCVFILIFLNISLLGFKMSRHANTVQIPGF